MNRRSVPMDSKKVPASEARSAKPIKGMRTVLLVSTLGAAIALLILALYFGIIN